MSASELLALGSATLAESGASAVAAGTVRPMWVGAACAGPARTIRCAAGDNLAIHVAVSKAHPGEVLVVEVEGSPDRGFWGEVLTVAAQARGVAGLVIEACVRDTAGLESRCFPVFATGTALPGATKVGPGAVGIPVVVGGATVRLGDVVVADGDGVAVIASDALDEVQRAAGERAAREQQLFTRLAQGATTIDLLGPLDVESISSGGA
jgi:4-hydroxy-4-methyl-2-oxoglutarate aldolase